MSTNTSLVQMPANDGKTCKPTPVKASVWNKDWKYTPAGDTDLAKTFRRIRREQELEAARKMLEIK